MDTVMIAALMKPNRIACFRRRNIVILVLGTFTTLYMANKMRSVKPAPAAAE